MGAAPEKGIGKFTDAKDSQYPATGAISFAAQ
jgi:hypothetical protein